MAPSSYAVSALSVSGPIASPIPTLAHPLPPSRCRDLNLIGLSFHHRSGFRLGNSSARLRVLCSRQPKATVVTGKSWEMMILNSQLPVLVEFHASWCGPCRMVHRVIDEIALEYSGRLKCFVLHADNDSQVAEKYDVKAVPVVLLFKNGQKCESVVGTMPKEFYVAAVERVLN